MRYNVYAFEADSDLCRFTNCPVHICKVVNHDEIYKGEEIYVAPPCYCGLGKFQVFSCTQYKVYKSLRSAIDNTIKHYKDLPLEDTLALLKLKEKLCNDGH